MPGGPQARGGVRAQGQASARKRSFLVGTQTVEEGYDWQPPALTAVGGGGQFNPWTLQGTGWLQRLWFEFTWAQTGAGMTPITQTDMPWILIANVQLNDVNNEAIFGPFDGYTWMLTNKFGGYYDWDDPNTRQSFSFSSSATTGASTFILMIPLEIVNRDPIGAVASVNNTATLTVLVSMNTYASLGNAVASTTSSLSVIGTQEFYWEPRKQDKQGREIAGAPPANGTTQYWTQGSVPVNPGSINQQLITGLGYPFREYLFLQRLGASTAAASNRVAGDTGWPATFNSLKFEANMLLTQYDKALWIDEMARKTGFVGATDVRTAGALPGREQGVFGLFFNTDFFKKTVGGETRRSYLVTSPGSNFIVNMTVGGGSGGNLYSIVNYVAPGGGGASAGGKNTDTASLTGGS